MANEMYQTKRTKTTQAQTFEYLVYFIFGLLDILLVFRLFFKLLGANPGSTFVSGTYNLSLIFVSPFQGIFPTAVTQGVEATSVFEPATLVAIVVYALLAWGIVALVRILSREGEV